jgi:hypothetical protein
MKSCQERHFLIRAFDRYSGVVQHRLEDGREVDRHRVAVLHVVLALVEELEELEGLVGVLGLREHRPVLAVQRGHADLALRTVRPEHRLEVIGVAHVLGA